MYDDSTGLYYAKARYYDSNSGRFISEDSYEGDAKDSLSLNRYTYVMNNPVKYTDPSGNMIGTLEVILLIYTTGAILITTYGYLISPAGQKAIRNGAVAMYNGVIIAGKVVTKATQMTINGIINGASWVGGKIVDGASWVGDKTKKGWKSLKSLFAQKSKSKSDKKERSKTKDKGAKKTKVTNKGNEIDVTPSDNHTTTTKNPGPKGKSNSSTDIIDDKGNVITRRWYDSKGRAYRDVDMTNHGNPKQHPEVPHEHTWDWSSGKPIRK